jgi:large subunit ribosomal protein L10
MINEKTHAEGEGLKAKKNSKHIAHVPERKKKLVSDLAALMDQYNIIGVVNMENLPAKQLKNMRAQLREKVVLIMAKKRLIRLAVEKSKKENIKEMEKHIKGMPALLFTNDNPFSLFKLLKKNKSNAPIKPGQKAPREIIVHAGATNFAPGPIIGELGSLRIKAGIEGGKVAIKEDKVVAKEGDVVDSKLAGLLTRLGIEPMEIGLNLVAVYENGGILTSNVLDIDEEAFKNNLMTAASQAYNLAIFIALPLKDTIKTLLSKAHTEAYALAKEANIITSETIKEKLAQAEAEMNALKAKMPDSPAGEAQ